MRGLGSSGGTPRGHVRDPAGNGSPGLGRSSRGGDGSPDRCPDLCETGSPALGKLEPVIGLRDRLTAEIDVYTISQRGSSPPQRASESRALAAFARQLSRIRRAADANAFLSSV